MAVKKGWESLGKRGDSAIKRTWDGWEKEKRRKTVPIMGGGFLGKGESVQGSGA